jgi:hypothetical protein
MLLRFEVGKGETKARENVFHAHGSVLIEGIESSLNGSAVFLG